MRRGLLRRYAAGATRAALCATLLGTFAAPDVGAHAGQSLADILDARTVAAAAAAQDGTAASCVGLDMSGSLNETDPDRYAVSVLNLVADLATKAVVTVFVFSGEGPTGVVPLGTFNLAEGRDFEALRRKVAELERAERKGATPTAALVDAMYRHLEAQGTPRGGGCIIVSDGKPEPDTDGQYKQIAERLPAFAEKGWRLHAVALGSGEWVGPFLGIASQLGGAALQASSAEQLLGVALTAWSAYRSEPPPEVRGVVIGADGRATVPIELDPTIKRLTVLVARPDPTVTAILSTPQPAEVKAGDPRLVGHNADDRHYVFYGLADTKALGAGRWALEVRGPRGAQVHVAISKRTSLRLALVEPQAGLVLADRPSRICARLLDGDQPLGAAGAAVRLLTADGAGQQRTADLRDDGRPGESGDAVALDGTFCGRATFGPGAHRLRLEATTPGAGAAGAEASVLADRIAGFRLLEPRGVRPVVRDGEHVDAKLAQLAFDGGRVDPSIVKQLALVVRPAQGPERRIPLDPATALDGEGVLTVAFPAALADAPERAAPGPDGATPVPYTLVLEAGLLHRGQVVLDEVAATRATTVGVLPWPGPCRVAPTGAGLRSACAAVAEWPLLGPLALGLGGLLGALLALAVGIRLWARRGLGGDDAGGGYGGYGGGASSADAW